MKHSGSRDRLPMRENDSDFAPREAGHYTIFPPPRHN